ncbi:MAG TPA: ParB N-terminal domain-containing protein [Candidatus Dormibacteraeota bacterium]
MRSEHDAAIDHERFELRLFPADPPATADIQVEERRLPYEPTVAGLSPALARVVERFGLPERPLVVACEDGEEEEFQVLAGARWIRAAREAGMDRVPVTALELSDVSAAFLALVLNQQWAADVASQADALQSLLEHGLDEEELARASGLGRGRLRRLGTLLELHPVLRQALRAGRLKPQLAFSTAVLSPESQEALAAVFEQEGELTSADLRNLPEMAVEDGETDAQDGSAPAVAEADEAGDADPGEALAALRVLAGASEVPAARARRQAEELLRTLEQVSISGEIRQRVAEVVEELGRIAD